MRSIILKYCLGVNVFLLLATGASIAQTQQHIIQTAFIEKFSNYIEWPARNSESQKAFKIVIVDNLELCELVENTFDSRKIKGMKVDIKNAHSLENISGVDLLFLASNKVKDLEEAMALCQKHPFLLVTDSDGFAKRGAHVNFYITPEQTIHFEMNKASLDRDKFKVDFLLLDFAKVVKQ